MRQPEDPVGGALRVRRAPAPSEMDLEPLSSGGEKGRSGVTLRETAPRDSRGGAGDRRARSGRSQCEVKKR